MGGPSLLSTGGAVSLATGAGGSGSASGSIVLATAAMMSETINTGKSGGLYLSTGATGSGNSGPVSISTGTVGVDGHGGDIVLAVGTSAG